LLNIYSNNLQIIKKERFLFKGSLSSN